MRLQRLTGLEQDKLIKEYEEIIDQFGSNLFNMIDEFWDKENKVINFDLEDEILSGCVITHQGNIVNESIK